MTDDILQDARPLRRRFAAVVAVAFVALIAAGPLLLAFGPDVRTRAAKPFPDWSTDAFLEGRFTEELRLHLRETSPVTVACRGVWSEVLFLLGLLEPPVVVGRGGALFAPSTLRPSARILADERAERVAFHRELAAWAAARGIHVLCVPVPDKVRVMPERLPDGTGLSPLKRGAYAALLDELAEGGIAAVDVAAAMARWRAERPEVALFRERDTHWTAAGAWRTSVLVADELDARGWLDGVPRDALVGMPGQTVRAPEDLAGLFGFLPHGLFEPRLVDTWTIGGARELGPAGTSLPMARLQPDADVAVCGDSFAEGSLAWTLPLALGRKVDSEGAMAAKGPLTGLLATLERVARGELRPKVVVWEFIERSQAERWWTPRPRLP